MKILFVARHFGALRNYERPIFALAARGHALHLAALADDILGGRAMVERWAAAEPRITFERLESPPLDNVKADLLERVHLMVDYLRYLDPAYAAADGLVERARRRTPRGLVSWLDRPIARRWPARPVLSALLRGLERATPRRPEVDRYLAAQRPDLALFTPLIGLGSEEQDYLAAAAEMGIRSVFCVWSWDNLSSKSIVRTLPDRVMVWNETQRDEAVHLHGVPPARVVVTGAQSFDQWFERAPGRSREAFCARVGLPSDRPILLWVCSALFKGSPVEARFVRQWIQAIRAHGDPVLRESAILVRPHPSRRKEWADVPLDDLGHVALWGDNPIDPESKTDYFDSLYYSAAVAGLNTSAFLEAAIVGRPVHTVLLPQYYDNQEGTLHFPYLMQVAGGLLQAARTMPEHMDDLARALRDPSPGVERSRRFVAAFIRPGGREASATDRFVQALEDLLRQPATPRPRGSGLFTPVFRRLLDALEERGQHGRIKEWLMSPTEYEEACRRRDRLAADRARQDEIIRERLARKQVRLQQKEQALEEKRRLKREAKARAQAERTAATGQPPPTR